MKKACLILALASVSVLSVVRATTITENFTNDPSLDGWQVFGDTNLFQWDSTNHVLDVTWDSSQPNSYFYRPLGLTLTTNDSFCVQFDLQVNDAIAGGYGAPLAVGLLHLSDATNAWFSRAFVTSPNLFEFDYYPADDFGDPASIAASLVDTATNFYFTYDDVTLNPGVTYHILLLHQAGTSAISGEVFANGQLVSSLPNIYTDYPAGDAGAFQLDTLSISSFSDDGYDTILAHGTVDNFVVTLPPVVRNFTGALSNGVWQAQCGTYTDWLYTLERSTNLISWSDVSTSVNGTGDILILSDTNAPVDRAFYRVRAGQ